MQDLAGLRVGCLIVHIGLEMRQAFEHAARHARIEPQHLKRGNDAVASERCRIPGNAGIRIRSLRRIRHQHVEVGHRAAQNLVEEIVRGCNGRDIGGGPCQGAMRGEQSLVE